jgi:trans-aconitate methyltransferase
VNPTDPAPPGDAPPADPRPAADLFTGTAWWYARYRPPLPPAFVDRLAERCRLDGGARLLDLGCGTGRLTLPLARHVAEAVGLDAEPEMLAEAARQAPAAGVGDRPAFERELTEALLDAEPSGEFTEQLVAEALVGRLG